jgi:hypothetical protein
MKKTAVVWVLVVGCASSSSVSEEQLHQSLEHEAATFRFTGALPDEGTTCVHSPHYRNSLCGASFHGYFTIPSTPIYDGYYETPFDEQGFGVPPYGMVLEVEGKRPRLFYYVTVSIGNDITNWLDPEGPLIDTFHIASSASNSNDGFDASFIDPTGSAVDGVELMPDPASFSEVCSDNLGGCPLVVGDARSDFVAIDLQLTRSAAVIAVPREDTAAPYFAVSATDWSDTDHTIAVITLDIFDDYTFASSTCDLWVKVRDADGVEHAVEAVARHSARGQRQAVLSIETGSANPGRQLRDANVTCTFALPGTPVIETTAIWSTYPY